jgi:soluble lytic murein transglycosylase-like protein
MDLVKSRQPLWAAILCVPLAVHAANPIAPCSIDPWEPYIAEAGLRFDLSPRWLRAVMQAESAGCEFMGGRLTTSSAGAIGLMQLMPRTWNMLRNRLSLGSNPYDPHDNILAAAAYLRELWDRFGTAGFIAAYHAGPERYEAFLAEGRALPDATLDYLARIERIVETNHEKALTHSLVKPSGHRSLFVVLRRDRNSKQTHSETATDVQLSTKP